MARAIAICKGGPLDGQHFSVPVDEQGSPGPLTSRADIVGVLYVPGSPVDVTDDMRARFYSELHGDVDVHTVAFEYMPDGEA